MFVAARVRNPKTGDEAWGEYRPGSDTPRPVRLPDAPELWQPLSPGTWGLDLPEPVTASQVRMTTERTRFALVEEAEAADLAREMEADREMADVSRPSATGLKAAQWWRDATTIRYNEEPPNLTLRSVEGRLMRAVACCDANHGMPAALVAPVWEMIGFDLTRALAEKELTQSPDTIPRFDPLPCDHADFLTAMAWFTALYPPERRQSRWQHSKGLERLNTAQQVLIRRAANVGRSFDDIGIVLFSVDCRKGRREEIERRIHGAGNRAQTIYKDAVEDCWRLANGMAPRKGVARPVDHMAALRERNRRAKRMALA